MQKNIIIITIVVILLLLTSGGYFIYTDMQEQQRMANEKVKQEQLAIEQKNLAEAEAAKLLKCVDGDDFSVVTRDHKDSVGQDILVKTKGATVNGCVFSPVEGDFDLTNADAQYYKAQVANSLLTDIGTGPSGRKFRLYDLKDKSMITEKDYFGELVVASGTLSYFGLPKTKADKNNCKDFAQFTKDGLTPNLVVKKTIDLLTYSAKEGKETKCVANQQWNNKMNTMQGVFLWKKLRKETRGVENNKKDATLNTR